MTQVSGAQRFQRMRWALLRRWNEIRFRLRPPFAALQLRLPPILRTTAWAVFLSLLLALVVLTAAVGVRLAWVPAWQLSEANSPAETVQRINEYRLALGPVFVGMLQALAGAAILFGFWLNVREHEFTRLQHRQQRLKDAILQLESGRVSTRVAALLELESIALEAPEQLERIVDIVRVHVQTAAQPSAELLGAPLGTFRTLDTDLITGFGILARLTHRRKDALTLSLDLRRVDFKGLSVFGIRFDESDFSESRFDRGWLPTAPRAKFRGAEFRSMSVNGHAFRGAAIPSGAYLNLDLDGADFTGAQFYSCHFMLASMRRTILDDATFIWTHLNADLGDASMRNVRFDKGYFEPGNLEGADLTGTTFDGTRTTSLYGRHFEKCKATPMNYPEGYR